MSNLQFFGALAAVVLASAGPSIAAIWYLGAHLGGRMQRLEDHLGGRMDRLEERMTSLEITMARIAQHLEDHIENHPGPTRRAS